jgi:hypothetical protein
VTLLFQGTSTTNDTPKASVDDRMQDTFVRLSNHFTINYNKITTSPWTPSHYSIPNKRLVSSPAHLESSAASDSRGRTQRPGQTSKMGLAYNVYLNSHKIYGCKNCKAHLSNHEDIISRVYPPPSPQPYLRPVLLPVATALNPLHSYAFESSCR